MADTATRLHHSARVVRDLAASRGFYENVLGLPLVATWCERNRFGEICHAFFGLEDQSAVALFQFASEEVYQAMRRPDGLSHFHHLALNGTAEYQASVRVRADAVGLDHRTVDHGYCTSLYLEDPDGHVVEIASDSGDAIARAAFIRDRADSELRRWLAGDHTTNNDLRDAASGH